MKKNVGMVLVLSGFMLLSGCLIFSGNYELTVVDADGNNLMTNPRMFSDGRSIYATRNALCSLFPGAIVHIKDIETGNEVSSESPYKCWK